MVKKNDLEAAENPLWIRKISLIPIKEKTQIWTWTDSDTIAPDLLSLWGPQGPVSLDPHPSGQAHRLLHKEQSSPSFPKTLSSQPLYSFHCIWPWRNNSHISIKTFHLLFFNSKKVLNKLVLMMNESTKSFYIKSLNDRMRTNSVLISADHKPVWRCDRKHERLQDPLWQWPGLCPFFVFLKQKRKGGLGTKRPLQHNRSLKCCLIKCGATNPPHSALGHLWVLEWSVTPVKGSRHNTRGVSPFTASDTH